MRTPGLVAALMASALAACAPAMQPLRPVAALGRTTLPPSAIVAASAADVDRVLADAETGWARRPDLSSVNRALALFVSAARANDARIEGLIGAAKVSSWLIEHEPDGARRSALATDAVQACQWCARRDPGSIVCTYRLALALGQEAREHRATAIDAMKKVVPLLETVIARAPTLDEAGGHRVLALVLLRAPGWPTGPGDAEAGLEHARQADSLVADSPQNLLVLGEALAAVGQADEADRVYRRAEALARTKAAAGDADAREWADQAARAPRKK